QHQGQRRDHDRGARLLRCRRRGRAAGGSPAPAQGVGRERAGRLRRLLRPDRRRREPPVRRHLGRLQPRRPLPGAGGGAGGRRTAPFRPRGALERHRAVGAPAQAPRPTGKAARRADGCPGRGPRAPAHRAEGGRRRDRPTLPRDGLVRPRQGQVGARVPQGLRRRAGRARRRKRVKLAFATVAAMMVVTAAWRGCDQTRAGPGKRSAWWTWWRPAVGGGLTPVAQGAMCVTLGETRPLGDGRFAVADAKVRGYGIRTDGRAAELRFVDRGPSKEVSRLGSGKVFHQLGLKLEAQDGCNVLYVMWRLEPATGV